MCFVEIVEVYDKFAFRRSVEPEVSDVRISTDDGSDAGGRQLRHVLCHQSGGTAQESVWRSDHSPHTDRNQPVESSLVCRVDLIDRVTSIGWGRPVAERRSRHSLAQAFPDLATLTAGRLTRPQSRPAVRFVLESQLTGRPVQRVHVGLSFVGRAKLALDLMPAGLCAARRVP